MPKSTQQCCSFLLRQQLQTTSTFTGILIRKKLSNHEMLTSISYYFDCQCISNNDTILKLIFCHLGQFQLSTYVHKYLSLVQIGIFVIILTVVAIRKISDSCHIVQKIFVKVSTFTIQVYNFYGNCQIHLEAFKLSKELHFVLILIGVTVKTLMAGGRSFRLFFF